MFEHLTANEKKAWSFFLHGVLAVILSLFMWRLTHVTWAWAVLFGPGAVMIFIGWVKAFHD
jgi:hypothetical protein